MKNQAGQGVGARRMPRGTGGARVKGHVVGRVMALTLLVGSGCGPVQSSLLNPMRAGGLVPDRQDRAGLFAVAPAVDLGTYRRIDVEPLTLVEASGWQEQDRRIASAVAASCQDDLVQRLRTSGLFDQVANPSAPASQDASAGTLRLEGRITQLELDSIASEYGWVGPGSLQLETRLIDESSGQIVAVTADRHTARSVTTATRDVVGSEGLLEEACGSAATDLVGRLRGLLNREGARTAHPSTMPSVVGY